MVRIEISWEIMAINISDINALNKDLVKNIGWHSLTDLLRYEFGENVQILMVTKYDHIIIF